MALLYTLGGAYANFPEVVRFGCIHRRHLRRSLLNLENLATSSPSARSFCHCCSGCIVLSAGKNDCMQRLRKSLMLATGAKNSIFQISLTVSWLLIFTALGGDIHWSWKATWSRTQRETHGQQSNPGQSTCNSPAQNFDLFIGLSEKKGGSLYGASILLILSLSCVARNALVPIPSCSLIVQKWSETP